MPPPLINPAAGICQQLQQVLLHAVAGDSNPVSITLPYHCAGPQHPDPDGNNTGLQRRSVPGAVTATTVVNRRGTDIIIIRPSA